MTAVRAGWLETWLEVARQVARRSGCERAQLGAVIVDARNRIVATGYNGPPAGWPGCSESCPRAFKTEPTSDYGDCIAIHAEANALLFCDRREREGGTIYVTGVVCWDCAKLIANSGLKRVVYVHDGATHRQPERSLEMLRMSGLEALEYT